MSASQSCSIAYPNRVSCSPITSSPHGIAICIKENKVYDGDIVWDEFQTVQPETTTTLTGISTTDNVDITSSSGTVILYNTEVYSARMGMHTVDTSVLCKKKKIILDKSDKIMYYRLSLK